MKKALKDIVKRSSLYYPLRNWLLRQKQTKEVKLWEKQGRPSPSPHIIKQHVLKAYAMGHKIRVLVETGTYIGDMIEAMKHSFDRIFSIELDRDLYKRAKKRFTNAKHIEIIQGDSGVQLAKLVENIQQPALFWLDAHYSAGVTARSNKDTPIYTELNHILLCTNFGHIILIDDARCFGIDPAYPTIDELKNYINQLSNNVDITVKFDIIRLTPK